MPPAAAGGAAAGGPATGAGGSSASGGAGSSPPVAGWIDPDLLEIKFDDCVCALCFGVMVEPCSGCPEGHSCCRACFVKELQERRRCPTCRHPVAGEQKLVRNRPLEGMISQLRMRCKHAEGNEAAAGAPPAAKRAKLAPAASMTVEALRKEMRQRGLDSTGNKPELVARLDEDRTKDAGCRWRGSVGELSGHFNDCGWAPAKCPNEGCAESPLRKDLPEHNAVCEHRVQKCRHCGTGLMCRLLAEHEGCCPSAIIECPNEGCSAQHQRGFMNQHGAICPHEEVVCPCPRCDARLLRKDMDAHVEATHQDSWVKLLQSAWSQNAALERTVESELRLAAPSPTSWVFNWRADAGWGPGYFKSETHQIGGGVTGNCLLQPPSGTAHSHFIGVLIEGRAKRRMHLTFSILDKHDEFLRKIREFGTATAPLEVDFSDGLYKGDNFTPTAEEKAQSVRADGSIRLRVVVRLFLDGAV